MKQTFQVLGMTCQNCQKKVTEKISSIEGLSNVEVSLEKAAVSFDSLTAVTVELLSNSLGAKYTVQLTPAETAAPMPSKWKQLRPLFLIFFYITAASIMLSNGASMSLFMTYFMGLFYLVFGFFKFLDYQGFPTSFRQYDPIAKRVGAYAWVYPFIETALGMAFLYQFELQLALWMTLFILGSTTFGVVQQLRKKEVIQCACLGTALNLPMTEATLIENTIMILMAISMLLGMI